MTSANLSDQDESKTVSSIWVTAPLLPVRFGMWWWKRWLCVACGAEFRSEQKASKHISEVHKDA